MLRQFALAWMLLCSAALAADPEPAPLPRVVVPPKPFGPGSLPLPLVPRPVPVEPVAAPPEQASELSREAARLKAEREALVREREKLTHVTPVAAAADAAELARLRRRMAELFLTLKIDPSGRPRPPSSDDPPARPPRMAPDNEPSSERRLAPTATAKEDPFLLAQLQFRAGQYEASLAAFRRLDPESLSQEERVVVQFFGACCLRKLGKLEEAAAIYRDVADAREDDFLTECAVWHLSAIAWRRDVEKQLEEFRKLRRDR
jgi:tetratricopeptide (TPR) repeat protein